MAFWFFMTFVISIRLGECAWARRNEKWLQKHGAVEYGQKHYPYMIALHTCFILSMIGEYILSGNRGYSVGFFVVFLFLLLGKGWVIHTLGRFWNTKIFRIHNYSLVRKGPYRFLSHPNYVIVVAEIVVIPLVFHLYCTAVLFSILNSCMLYVRIKEENKALKR